MKKILIILLFASSAFGQATVQDLMGLGCPGPLAEKFATGIVSTGDYNIKSTTDVVINALGGQVYFKSNSVQFLTLQNTSILPETDNALDLGSASVEFKNAYFDGIIQTDAITLDGDLTYTATDTLIGASSSDAADSKQIAISGGGAATDARGGFAIFYGNEDATNPADVVISSGDIANGDVQIKTKNATSQINLMPAGAQSASVTTAGIVIPATKSLNVTAGVLILPQGLALPATCSIGELAIDTNSNDCANTGGGDGALCICKTTNTWALISNY